ncbi:MAG TPA: cupin domain-containing protein [Rhizomicrobium sp.]|jgi:hypothetical protein|nr:cupin domain-containing protein [Rhizomicrobium sp.]
MILSQAEDIFRRLLDPMPLDEFLDEIIGERFIKLAGGLNKHSRALLLGNDPESLLLDSFAQLAPKIGCHAAAPSAPPPEIEPVPDTGTFRDKIGAFHARGYTVRLPEIRNLTPQLDQTIRAMELVFHQPVKVEAFWSRGDAKAPVHHDDYDIIVVHLKGNKRWFISSLRSDLPNAWKTLSDAPPRVDRFAEVDVEPGDLLYLPRGTTHRVDAVADSIHLSIGFIPLTLREAVIACLDYVSDTDRPLRETVGARAGAQAQTSGFGAIPRQIRDALALLAKRCDADAFITEALQHRAARVIGNLDKLSPVAGRTELSPSTRLRQNPLGISHLVRNSSRIDFAYPGGHHLIHRGVEQSVTFIANTPEFCIKDIPGAVGDDIRLALAERFVSCGFLEVCG